MASLAVVQEHLNVLQAVEVSSSLPQCPGVESWLLLTHANVTELVAGSSEAAASDMHAFTILL